MIFSTSVDLVREMTALWRFHYFKSPQVVLKSEEAVYGVGATTIEKQL